MHKVMLQSIRGTFSSLMYKIAQAVDGKHEGPFQHSEKENEYLNWVRFAVPGMLCPGNVLAMEYAIANMPQGKPILEIGSFCGLSTVVLSYYLDKYSIESPFFSCDKWNFEGQTLGTQLGDSKTVTHDMYREYVKTTFLRSMNSFTPHRLPYTIECFADDFFCDWFDNVIKVDVFDRSIALGGKIGFCYIDGNHTYEFALRDFENTDRALVSGGFILFDDSADGSAWEVNRLTRRIASGSEYELISKTPNYLFRKK